MIQTEIQRQIADISKWITKLESIEKSTLFPDGDISCHKTAKGKFYTVRTCEANGKKRDRYIKRTEKHLAKQLVLKLMCGRLLTNYKKALHMLERFQLRKLEQAQRLHARISRDYEELIPQELLYYPEKSVRWANTSYPKNEYPIPEDQQHLTDKGDIVRSKLECMGLNCIYSMGLQFQLEPAIRLKNGEIRYLDCQILSPYTGQIIYIEFFGLMNNPDYVKRTIHKINVYEDNGLVMGENFLPVFEIDGEPFDPRRFKRQLERLLRA